MAEITRILEAIDEGDAHAAEELLPLVYDELRRLAAQKLSHEKPGQTLQATALVHEMYLRLLGSDISTNYKTRAHFFGAAAEAMRRILIERARQRASLKRGGDMQRIEYDEAQAGSEPRAEDLLSLDAALDGLEAKDPTMANIVKLRYFAGLTVPETADALELSARSVNRHWTAARAWLHREMGDSVVPDDPSR